MPFPDQPAPSSSPLEALLPDPGRFVSVGPGSLIGGRFEVLEEVGAGSNGRIFRVRDRILDEQLALKVLRPELAATGTTLARFLAEIRLARRISHPNVCRIHDYGEEGEIRYITMEYLEGTDLESLLVRRRGVLELDEAYPIALGAAVGLGAIHEAGVLHRDLKPANIMIDTEGQVRVMDFGIAKAWGRRNSLKLTGEGTILGTPEYMSPEQITGERLDQRADIYSLGVVCFEIFTGQVPFSGENLLETLLKQVSAPLPLDRPEVERLPAVLRAVLCRTLEKRPADRYTSVAELISALQVARRAADGYDRRRHSRLEFPLACRISAVASAAHPLREERTVAENLSPGGVRVRTTLSWLREGDRVSFEEEGGSFRTPSEVRCCRLGADNVHRLHLRFLGQQPPRHLVGAG